MLSISPTTLTTQIKIPIPKKEFIALSHSKTIDNKACFNSNIVRFGYELILNQEPGLTGHHFLEECREMIADVAKAQCDQNPSMGNIQLPEAEIVDLSKTVTDMGYSRDIVEPIVECAYDFLKSHDEKTAQSFLLKCDYSVAKRVLRAKYIRDGNQLNELDNSTCRALMKHKLIECATSISNKSLVSCDEKTRKKALEDFETILEVVGLGIPENVIDFNVISHLQDPGKVFFIGDRVNFGRYLAA
jgi:hypothetical protein